VLLDADGIIGEQLFLGGFELALTAELCEAGGDLLGWHGDSFSCGGEGRVDPTM